MMIVENIPKEFLAAFAELEFTGRVILGDGYESMDSRSRLSRIEEKIKDVGLVNDYPNATAKSQGQHFSILGYALAKLIEGEFGWRVRWLREPAEGIEDGVLSVISEDERYVIYPILAIRKTALGKAEHCRNIYFKLCEGQLSEAGKGELSEVT